jgi:outer membrane biosynthesis protein TonB
MNEERRQIGLPLALAFSALLHLALLLITVWSPLSFGTEPVTPAPEESVLRFTFAPETEQDVEGRLEGDVPFEQPESAEAQPQPSEPAAPDFRPEGRPSLEPPSSGAPPTPRELQELLEQQERRRAEQELQEPEESEFDETASPELADDPNADLSGAGELARPVPTDPRPQWSVDRALREWGRALDEYRASQPTTPGGGQPRNVFTPEPGTFPTTGYGMGNLVFESRDFDWSDYARQIYIAIWRAWHQRLYETTDEFEKWAQQINQSWWIDHRVQVRFVIEEDGNVSGIVVENSSTCPPLDDSAADALAEVVLPPLPDDFPRDSETVHARFIAVGDIKTMRQVLGYYKRMGLF